MRTALPEGPAAHANDARRVETLRVETAADRSDLRPMVVPSGAVRPVVRRRRVLASLLGGAGSCTALGFVPALRGLWWAAAVLALLAVSYLALVSRLGRVRARRDLVRAFAQPGLGDGWDWTELEWEMSLSNHGSKATEDLEAAAVVAVDNRAVARFLAAYALGWALTPAVLLIRLVRGDLSGLERHGLVGRVVRLQQYGRSQSLRLLTVGAAATVGVTAGGAVTASAALATSASVPASAAVSASAARSTAVHALYTVRPGDTLSAIAARSGTTVAALAQANGIADPNFVLAGQQLTIPAGGTSGSRSQPSATGASGAQSYAVQAGDTLSAIAERSGTTVAALAAANHLADPNLIFPGEVLAVPGGGGGTVAVPAGAQGTYTVRPGDTLNAIAARFGTTAAALAALNHIADPNLILVGQVLSVVEGASGPAATPATGATPKPVATPTATPTSAPPSGGSGYVNPFVHGSWSASRTDEGVDWIPNVASPVVAIGNGVVTYSSTASGWPGGAFLTYRLTSGSHAGLYIYVAEHLSNLAPVGTTVSAGQVIATGLPGYPWTEWGWASPSGPEPAASAQYNGSADGTATPGGRAFARFLIELGATGVQNPGPGSDRP